MGRSLILVVALLAAVRAERAPLCQNSTEAIADCSFSCDLSIAMNSTLELARTYSCVLPEPVIFLAAAEATHGELSVTGTYYNASGSPSSVPLTGGALAVSAEVLNTTLAVRFALNATLEVANVSVRTETIPCAASNLSQSGANLLTWSAPAHAGNRLGFLVLFDGAPAAGTSPSETSFSFDAACRVAKVAVLGTVEGFLCARASNAITVQMSPPESSAPGTFSFADNSTTLRVATSWPAATEGDCGPANYTLFAVPRAAPERSTAFALSPADYTVTDGVVYPKSDFFVNFKAIEPYSWTVLAQTTGGSHSATSAPLCPFAIQIQSLAVTGFAGVTPESFSLTAPSWTAPREAVTNTSSGCGCPLVAYRITAVGPVGSQTLDLNCSDIVFSAGGVAVVPNGAMINFPSFLPVNITVSATTAAGSFSSAPLLLCAFVPATATASFIGKTSRRTDPDEVRVELSWQQPTYDCAITSYKLVLTNADGMSTVSLPTANTTSSGGVVNSTGPVVFRTFYEPEHNSLFSISVAAVALAGEAQATFSQFCFLDISSSVAGVTVANAHYDAATRLTYIFVSWTNSPYAWCDRSSRYYVTINSTVAGSPALVISSGPFILTDGRLSAVFQLANVTVFETSRYVLNVFAETDEGVSPPTNIYFYFNGNAPSSSDDSANETTIVVLSLAGVLALVLVGVAVWKWVPRNGGYLSLDHSRDRPYKAPQLYESNA
eukprot:m.235526 g.235526  ORF g.235526 m.235526 type:complete len:721 (-) comp12842_c0_seq1:227-2389(-)